MSSGWRRTAAVLLAIVAWGALAPPAQAVDIQRLKTPLGIELWYVREPSLPIIAASIVFQEAGAASVPADKEGLSYLTQVLLDEGAGDLKSLDFQRRLEDLAIDLNFDANTDTFGVSLRTLTERADEAFRLTGLALAKPRFDEDAIERMRNAILIDLTERLDDPDDILNRAFSANTFPGHGYGRSVRGTIEAVEKLTRQDLQDYVRSRFTRDRVVVGAVGDLPIEQVGRLVDLALGDLPAIGTSAPIAEVKPIVGDEVRVLRKEIPQSSVLLSAWGIKRDDPDYYAAVILNSVLGGASFLSRLWTEVREERGLAYSVSTSNSPLEHTAYFVGYVATNNEHVAESVRIIREEIERIVREGVTPDELAASKVYLIGSFALSLDTNARIARTLVSMQISKLGADYIDRRVEYYNAVTQDDIKRVARRIFLGDANGSGPVKLTTTIIGDPQNIAATPVNGTLPARNG